MSNLDDQCQAILREELDKFLSSRKDLLSTLPVEMFQRLSSMRSQATITADLKVSFGDTADLAFVLQHGSQDFPPLQMVSILDRVVGKRVTDLIEKV